MGCSAWWRVTAFCGRGGGSTVNSCRSICVLLYVVRVAGVVSLYCYGLYDAEASQSS